MGSHLRPFHAAAMVALAMGGIGLAPSAVEGDLTRDEPLRRPKAEPWRSFPPTPPLPPPPPTEAQIAAQTKRDRRAEKARKQAAKMKGAT